MIIYQKAEEIFNLPLMDLLFKAQTIHRENFKPNEIQISKLMNVKTGSCPEDCKYCSQSAHYNTGLKKEPLSVLEEVIKDAKEAKELGATRFCIGAAWRSPKNSDLEKVCTMISKVKKLGLETCATIGLLKDGQAEKLKEAGLDFCNHNIDTSEEYYKNIITTRTFQSRVDTLKKIRNAGIKVCCGGIIGMGETNKDRISMIVFLANLEIPPESVPINQLIPIPGTPLENSPPIDPFDFIRVTALSRILMPKSYVRITAGRHLMSFEMQALCFLAGANSIFCGEKLLTSPNSTVSRDEEMFKKFGLKKEDIKHI